MKSPEEERNERLRKRSKLSDFSKPPIEDSSKKGSNSFEDLSSEERRNQARELMDSTEGTNLKLEVGELEKINPDTIIERTEDGFQYYIVVDK
jgi:hypothetical protein